MYSILIKLIDRLDYSNLNETDIISWGCPIPSFGDLVNSHVATLGLNPSTREFVDGSGNELEGTFRRFHTLNSLGIESWKELNVTHIKMIIESCIFYFQRNPYNTWFKRLDRIISGTDASYYQLNNSACHLDIIPYATSHKWIELSMQQRLSLLKITGDALGLLIRDSSIELLILNGMSVIQLFKNMTDIFFTMQEMIPWSLPRQSKTDVKGVGYIGMTDTISGVYLERNLLILGFNHNLQSSYGVTNEIIGSIRNWVTRLYLEVKN